MNWKNEAENSLKNLPNWLNALKNIPKNIDKIDHELTFIVQFRENSPACDSYINNLMKKYELQRNLELTKQRIELIENGLGCISSEDRRILEAFYVNRESNYLELLTKEIGCAKSSLYNYKDRALKEFTLAMYS